MLLVRNLSLQVGKGSLCFFVRNTIYGGVGEHFMKMVNLVQQPKLHEYVKFDAIFSYFYVLFESLPSQFHVVLNSYK